MPNRHSNGSNVSHGKPKLFMRFSLLVDLKTGPLIAVLFLLSISAVGRQQLREGTLGANNLSPIDVLAFSLTLGYITGSIDATGVLRYLSLKILLKCGHLGHRLFFYLYALFFVIGCLFGNDPVIQMGMLFVTYMARASSNIIHPRAWLHTQFALANTASAIFVSSNTTNVVIAQAFRIRFAEYTANMIVPVVVTTMIFFPFLLYIVFANEALVPLSIKIHELDSRERASEAVASYNASVLRQNRDVDTDELSQHAIGVEEVLNPFLDKPSVVAAGIIIVVVLVILMALSASHRNDISVFWVTLPGAVLMLLWDIGVGWRHSRTIARRAQGGIESLRTDTTPSDREPAAGTQINPAVQDLQVIGPPSVQRNETSPVTFGRRPTNTMTNSRALEAISGLERGTRPGTAAVHLASERGAVQIGEEEQSAIPVVGAESQEVWPRSHEDARTTNPSSAQGAEALDSKLEAPANTPDPPDTAPPLDEPDTDRSQKESVAGKTRPHQAPAASECFARPTLTSLVHSAHGHLRERFPVVMAVLPRLPFPLVPFVFPMFTLVQALAATGWVAVFAHGWDKWTEKTGTVGAIAGMGFLSVVLSNVSSSHSNVSRCLLRPSLVYWHQHRRYRPSLPYHPSLGTNPPRRRDRYTQSHILGNSIRSGAWR
jgi:Na+/H+ antiporter NhaD/arsenite permease-like protein